MVSYQWFSFVTCHLVLQNHNLSYHLVVCYRKVILTFVHARQTFGHPRIAAVAISRETYDDGQHLGIPSRSYQMQSWNAD